MAYSESHHKAVLELRERLGYQVRLVAEQREELFSLRRENKMLKELVGNLTAILGDDQADRMPQVQPGASEAPQQPMFPPTQAQGGTQWVDNPTPPPVQDMVNVGGPFNASPARMTLDPPAFLATTTSSGTVWRAFGSEEDAQTRYRLEDPIRQLPTLTEPRELRLEDACRARSASRALAVARHLGERTADMVADGEARSQRRFHTWAMSSLVPEEAQRWKAKVLPFFDEFASTCSSSRRSPHCTADSFFDTKTSKTSETWKQSTWSTAKSTSSTNFSKDIHRPPPPSTPQEVGQWLSDHDALQSVTGDAMKSACGWSSGFRKDPMSMEEVLNVRILERSNAAFAKRKKELELYKSVT